jgi:glycosyltransferase involved in cell wall biosynthesis
MKLPLISVIIPVHNQQNYLGRCLRSILDQSLAKSKYEIIVIDDGSTDNSKSIYNIFLDNIILIKQKKNYGLPSALNKGIKCAKGRFLIRLDADDYVHHEYLKILSLFLSLNDDIDAVACDYLLVDSNEKVIEIKNCMDYPIGCGIMFRQSHIVELGMYDEKQLIHEEKDLRTRFMKKYSIKRVELPLYRYRKHENNMTNNKELMRHYEKILLKKKNE